MPQKSYRRKVVVILMQRVHPVIISVYSSPEKSFRIPDEIRFDAVGNYSISCPVRMCVLCGKNSRKPCEKYK